MNALYSAFQNPHSALKGWLPDMDLNHDKQIQSLLCYRYTIGQTGTSKVEPLRLESRLAERLSRCASQQYHHAQHSNGASPSPRPSPLGRRSIVARVLCTQAVKA